MPLVAEILGDIPTNRKTRWYVPTPAKFLVAVLVMQGVLFLSAHYRWFWFNERKGFTVLITVTATAATMLMLVAAILVNWFFKSKLQFGLATLFLMIPAIGVPCAWLGQELEQARRQIAVISSIQAHSGNAHYPNRLPPNPPPSIIEVWTLPILGHEFFHDVGIVILRQIDKAEMEELQKSASLSALALRGPKITDDSLRSIQRLEHLEYIEFIGAPITDAGLEHLKEMKNLVELRLHRTNVTRNGVNAFTQSLPNCRVEQD